MGLPKINIAFSGKSVSAIERSQRGVVALILKDDTGAFNTKEYTNVDEIGSADWTANNLDYIKIAFMGTPKKVIVERLDVAAIDYTDALTRLSFKKWDYLAIPDIETTTDVASWIKGKIDNDKRTFKAVLPNTVATDHEGIINFTTTDIERFNEAEGESNKIYTTAEYTVRLAGIFAGLPFTRSSTYYVLPEVVSIAEIADPDAAIDAGELILVNDGEKIKIGRGVNSLTTTTDTKTEDFKKIKIVEVMHMVQDDIRSTFADEYVGKVNNIYDNQVLFLTAINSYFDDLADDEILDPNAANKAGIDVEEQRKALESIGTDTTDWSDEDVKENAFKSNVYVDVTNFKIVDAVEDLDFKINL